MHLPEHHQCSLTSTARDWTRSTDLGPIGLFVAKRGLLFRFLLDPVAILSAFAFKQEGGIVFASVIIVFIVVVVFIVVFVIRARVASNGAGFGHLFSGGFFAAVLSLLLLDPVAVFAGFALEQKGGIIFACDLVVIIIVVLVLIIFVIIILVFVFVVIVIIIVIIIVVVVIVIIIVVVVVVIIIIVIVIVVIIVIVIVIVIAVPRFTKVVNLPAHGVVFGDHLVECRRVCSVTSSVVGCAALFVGISALVDVFFGSD